MTEKRNAQSFIAEKVGQAGPPGGIVFMVHDGKVAGFSHSCPCGCGRWSFIRLNRENWSPETKTFWERTGPDDRMTLTPSIGIHPIKDGQYHWHGYLRDGLFEEC